MYYPYFRGKKNELLVIKENAPLMGANIVPIIEPVKNSPILVSSLKRAIEALIERGVRFVLIANPRCGAFCDGPSPLLNSEIKGILDHYDNWSVGCVADQRSTREEIKRVLGLGGDATVIHDGYPNGSGLQEMLSGARGITGHVFVEEACSSAYRRRFTGTRILVRDGFTQRINREYPEVEHFSDLHSTYLQVDMDGFGDFLIVGDEYSDRGGPAYAVAIHLTYIDGRGDDDMLIKHY